MKKIFIFIIIYFKFIYQKKDKWRCYLKKEFKSGNSYDSYAYGFEIVNTKTNKVVLRRGEFTNNLDSRFCEWQRIRINFIKNT